MKKYVKDILASFSNDKRIVLWDIYNEPGNSEYGNKSMPLVEKVFKWGREANPSQPLYIGLWNWELKELSNYHIKNSDVITYHNYGDSVNHKWYIDAQRSLSQNREYVLNT